jgi:hypothetical protein
MSKRRPTLGLGISGGLVVALPLSRLGQFFAELFLCGGHLFERFAGVRVRLRARHIAAGLCVGLALIGSEGRPGHRGILSYFEKRPQ